MSWRILITARTLDLVGRDAIALLKTAGCELTHTPGPHQPEALAPLLEGQDAALATTDRYTADVLGSPHAAALKIVSRWGVGYDAIDVNAATERGIVVCNTPGVLDEAVADFAFTMLLGIARRIHLGHDALRKGGWGGAWGHNVHGKTLGIVGCGRIGQAVARRAKGFNLQLLGYDIAPNPAAAQLGITFVPLDELLARSDFVSLHAALTPESRRLIGEPQIRLMKPTAYLINAGRGALIDEEALVRALRDGTIAGAALDTYVTEPLPAGHPLRDCPNTLLTPHCASYALETGETVSNIAAQALVDLMRGRKPRFPVNPAVFSSPALRARING